MYSNTLRIILTVAIVKILRGFKHFFFAYWNYLKIFLLTLYVPILCGFKNIDFLVEGKHRWCWLFSHYIVKPTHICWNNYYLFKKKKKNTGFLTKLILYNILYYFFISLVYHWHTLLCGIRCLLYFDGIAVYMHSLIIYTLVWG